MCQEKMSSICPMLLTFLAGAAVGAAVVALTTPRSGPELRGDLRNLARRAKGKVGDMVDEVGDAWDDMKGRAVKAGNDLQRGVSDAARDMNG